MGKCNIRAFVDTLETPTIETWDNNNNFLKSIKYSDETYYPLPVLTNAYNGYVLKVDENNQWMLSDDFLSHDWSKITWAGGTDEEIVAMVEAADKGLINLADYWTVGQERQVSLSAMAATGVGESHVAQTVTMVLMNAGGKTLANATESGRTTCSFIVGLKNGLANGTSGEYGHMNSSDINSGGWDSCARRTWCNSVFREAIPASLRSIFKQHLNITANGSSTTTTSSTDYFALPAEKEVFGSNTYGNSTAETSLTQFSYYTTSSNRIKKCGDSGSANTWWERSPRSGNSSRFCSVYSSGSAYDISASNTLLVSPFGCI